MDNYKLCAICGGDLESGRTSFTVDYTSGLVVVRDVPALVCSQCGESWIQDGIAEKLENIVEEAKRNHREFEVVKMAA